MKALLNETEDKMKKSVARLEHEFTTIRAGRANPAVLEPVVVDYYGVPTPIQQMAAVSVSEARILVIQPWDASTLKAIETNRPYAIKRRDENNRKRFNLYRNGWND